MAAIEPRFYVYRFLDEKGKAAYIGKGSGNRLKVQERRFGKPGEIVRRFHVEGAAYRFEMKLIGKEKPAFNKFAGGGGAIAHKRNAIPIEFRREFEEIERIGTRKWAAKMLLNLDLRGYEHMVDFEKLRQVAYS